jgi:hypothetical protein
MTTLTKRTANQRNSQFSTGPTTEAGIAVARMNALSHGLRAASPVVPGEDPDRWDQFREVMVADLAPVGAVEEELADRVALLSWRLRRVSSYEAGVVTRASDRAASRVSGELEPDELTRLTRRSDAPPTLKDVRTRVQWAHEEVARYERQARLFVDLAAAADDAPVAGEDALLLLRDVSDYLPASDDEDDELDDVDGRPDPMTDPRTKRFLLALGVPEEHHDEPEGWGGWTAGVVRMGVERVAKTVKWTRQKLLDRAVRGSAEELAAWHQRRATAERQLAEVTERTRVEEAEARRRALVPAVEVVEVVMKYEGHLQRQLVQALHELERRQALRSDCPPHPPAALDVTVHAPDGIPLLFGTG